MKVPSGDPLADVVALSDEIERLKRQLDSAIFVAHSGGVSLRSLAAVLGISKSAAYRRVSAVTEEIGAPAWDTDDPDVEADRKRLLAAQVEAAEAQAESARLDVVERRQRLEALKEQVRLTEEAAALTRLWGPDDEYRFN